jgi:hypothetical protein
MKVRIAGCEVDLIHNTDLIEALTSRDITISLLCMNAKGRIYDPLNYFADFENRVVRIVDPENKIVKDPTRIIRVLRFATELGFEIEQTTLKACMRHADLLRTGTAKFEVPKIRKLAPEFRQSFIALAQNLGIADQVMSVFRNKGVEIVTSNQELKLHVSKLKEFLGFSNFYVYGGSLRDTVLDRPIGDIDSKLNISTDEFINLLLLKGYEETDDHHLPEGYFFFNRRFNAVSIRLDGMVYDFTFIEHLDLDIWYQSCDLNCNALIMDAESGVILNSNLLDKVLLGVLELCDITQAELDPLKYINFLKYISKTKDLILDPTSIESLLKNMGNIYQYFKKIPRMIYRLKSILNRDNSDEAIDIIRRIPEGQLLLSLMES